MFTFKKTRSATRDSIVVLLSVLLATGCLKDAGPHLPPLDTIHHVTANLRRVPGILEEQVADFELKKSDYPKVLALFASGSVDRHPAKWQRIGKVTIHSIDGNVWRIDVFWTGQDIGAYTIDGTYYRGSRDQDFISMIQTATTLRNEK